MIVGTLEARFSGHANGLNLLRLLLAVEVILWHSFALLGQSVQLRPLSQFLGEIGVDGFFVISGFLIYRSWRNRPDWKAFATARLLRIFPAFWVCLLVTGLLLAPAGILFGGGNPLIIFADWGPLRYLVSNSVLWIFQPDINGTPANVPVAGAWNGSLWTLAWEFGCYVTVLAAGLIGLYRFRLFVPAAFVALLVANVAVEVIDLQGAFISNALRFALTFAGGMLLFELRTFLKVRPSIVALSGVVVLASQWLPDYRVVGVLPLAYFLVATATFMRSPRFQFRTDISYGVYIYAFPVQQVLLLAGLSFMPPLLFFVASTAATAPFAYASWILIEKNALKIKQLGRQTPTGPAPT